jgi:hypothetical protein
VEAGSKNNSDRLTRVVSHQNFKSALFSSGSKIIYAQYSVTPGLCPTAKTDIFSQSSFTLALCKTPRGHYKFGSFFPHFDYLHVKKYLLDIQ